MSLDKFLSLRYNEADYNCAHFSRDVILDRTGRNVGDYLAGFLFAPEGRSAQLSTLRCTQFLEKPRDACLVWFRGVGRSNHVGVWWRGKVIHLAENGSPFYVPLSIARLGFQEVRFIAC
jgi:hypothetical protein